MALRAQNLFTEQDQNILFPNRANSNAASTYRLNSILIGDRFYHQPAAFYNDDRVQLQFKVTEEFAIHFVLIKGLIEFSRSNQLNFTYSADQKRIDIDLSVTQFEELNRLFHTVHNELLKEIRFKTALKRAIQFEQIYKRESAKIYQSMNNEQ